MVPVIKGHFNGVWQLDRNAFEQDSVLVWSLQLGDGACVTTRRIGIVNGDDGAAFLGSLALVADVERRLLQKNVLQSILPAPVERSRGLR